MTKKKPHKMRRQQPRPKKKKGKSVVKRPATNNSFEDQFRQYGKLMMKSLEDKENIKAKMAEDIGKIEGYFKKYDTIQLLGSIGLYLIDNLPTLEKNFMAQQMRAKPKLDEDAEVIAEYALNYGLSMPNDGKETPTSKVVNDLRETLRSLYKVYGLLDMPLENNAEQYVDWIIHSETIAVRGDGYPEHLQRVFKELFTPHTGFYQTTYGFSINDLLQFFQEVEDRVICKIGSKKMITGPYKLWERWKKWDEKTYGPIDSNLEGFKKRDYSKGMFGEFFAANPDVGHTDDGMQFLTFPTDDYYDSDRIFWVLPQSEAEENILKALSVEFGDNKSFIAEGEYKGNIMNGHSIYEKPFVKDGSRYYCFTPMLPYRNMFLIAEKLMMCDKNYYENNFKNNTSTISRDNYVERKVKSVFQSFLPDMAFYPSVTYRIIENGKEKKPELDILGVSDKATYIVEVKAHELTHKDRVGLNGTKVKFRSSVTEACCQSFRAATYINNCDAPVFHCEGKPVYVDKAKPIYKIAITFQHYSSLLGQMDKLIEAGLMEESYRDTWIVSLFDLMVCSDFFDLEEEFIEYLDMHKMIYANHCTFTDELDLLGGFLNEDLDRKIKPGKSVIIMGGTQYIDDEYTQDYKISFQK